MTSENNAGMKNSTELTVSRPDKTEVFIEEPDFMEQQRESLLQPCSIQQNDNTNNSLARDSDILSELFPSEKDADSADERRTYGKKLRYTIFIFFTNFCLGCIYTLCHAAFLDLMQQTNSEIDQGAFVFVLISVGYTTGSLICGPLYDRLNADVIFGSCAVLGGAFIILIPFSPWLAVVSTLLFLSHIFQGSLDSGSIFLCARIWKDGAGPYQQGLALFFALGGVLGPLVAEPFLLPKIDNNNSSLVLRNGSSVNLSSAATNSSSTVWTDNNSTDDPERDLVTPELVLYVPFTVCGLLMMCSAIPFLVIFARTKPKCGPSGNVDSEMESGQNYKNSCICLLAALTLVVVFFTSYGFLFSLAELCMPFTVGYLGWSTASGAWLSSASSGAVVVGCCIGIFVANILRPSVMTVGTMIPITIGLIALLVGARYSNIIVWISYIVIFAGIGSLYPSAISWVDQRLVRANGRICSLFTVACCVGDATNVSILGHLFKLKLPMWLIYLSLGASVVQWATIFVLFRTNVWLSSRITEKPNEEVSVVSLK